MTEEIKPKKRKVTVTSNRKTEFKTSISKRVKPKSSRKALEEEREAYEEDILRGIRKYISNNYRYMEMGEYSGGILVGKAIHVNVERDKNKNIFSITEGYDPKDYFTLYVVEYSEFPERTVFIQDLLKTGCPPPLEINHMRMIKEVLDGI